MDKILLCQGLESFRARKVAFPVCSVRLGVMKIFRPIPIMNHYCQKFIIKISRESV